MQKPKIAAPPPRYSTGFLEDLDGRTAIAAEMRERFREFTDDLGGVDTLSYASRSLVERGLWLEYWLRQQERSLATGDGQFDINKWTQAVNAFQGILFKLGLDRKARDVTPLSRYIAQAGEDG
jgi:hypothetical protein